MSSDQPGQLRLSLMDVYGTPLGEPVDIFLRHQVLNEPVAARGVDASGQILVKGLRANPQGLYRLEVDPPSYFTMAAFVNIASSGVTDKAYTFAVDPKKVIRVDFPAYGDVPDAKPLLEASKNVLGFAGSAGKNLYDALDDIRRAGMLNILAKSRRTPLEGQGTAIEYYRELKEVRGDRFFVAVPQEFREHVKNSAASGLFYAVDETLHHPPDGFEHAGSWKTVDRYGNLQVTFFSDGSNWLCDVDIDDAAGLEHVFQVVRNAVTGQPTHPYNIHEILIAYQEIDPGYKLVVHQEAPAMVAAPLVKKAGPREGGGLPKVKKELLLRRAALLGLVIAGLDGIRFGHVLTLLGGAVPLVALTMEDLGIGVHPHHAGTAAWRCRSRRLRRGFGGRLGGGRSIGAWNGVSGLGWRGRWCGTAYRHHRFQLVDLGHRQAGFRQFGYRAERTRGNDLLRRSVADSGDSREFRRCRGVQVNRLRRGLLLRQRRCGERHSQNEGEDSLFQTGSEHYQLILLRSAMTPSANRY